MAETNLFKKLDFPHAPHIALKQLETCLVGGNVENVIPGLGPTKDELIEKLVEEHVFYRKHSSAGQMKRLGAIQELKLLDALNTFFDTQNQESLRFSMFTALFSSIPDADRRDILSRLISMAIGLQNKQLLECAAVWMQRQGCSTGNVTHIAETITDDYCTVVPESIKALHCLPQLSTHFTCNFITALTAIYSPPGFQGKSKKILATEMTELIVDWIENDPHVCVVSLDQSHNSYIQPQRNSLWTSPTKPNTQTAVPGLVRWCTQAPILFALLNKQGKTQSAEKTYSSEEKHKLDSLWSKLHLALLQSIIIFPTLPGANQLELITLADMNKLVKDIVALIREAKNKELHAEPDGARCIEIAIDRIVQVLQVGLATGAFRSSLGDLERICSMLPRNKLLGILENQHLARKPPPMHHEIK